MLPSVSRSDSPVLFREDRVLRAGLVTGSEAHSGCARIRHRPTLVYEGICFIVEKRRSFGEWKKREDGSSGTGAQRRAAGGTRWTC